MWQAVTSQVGDVGTDLRGRGGRGGREGVAGAAGGTSPRQGGRPELWAEGG